ncbi:hypothetical protein FXO37_26912 [Capsicum annuum]|nr:hypothetical protein FXO37_26912 [Capsicum annuum]
MGDGNGGGLVDEVRDGPMIYKGIYHLFYQYNPKSSEWGNIAWGHATSTDLVNWTVHPPTLSPSDPYDISGCWSAVDEGFISTNARQIIVSAPTTTELIEKLEEYVPCHERVASKLNWETEQQLGYPQAQEIGR